MSRSRRLLSVAILPAALLASSIANAQPIDLVIRVKERVSMQELAANAVKYGITYKASDIRKIAGPSKADYDNLIAQLKDQGFEIVNESKTHLFITVRAEKQSIEDAFQTKLVESHKHSINDILKESLTFEEEGLNLYKELVGLATEAGDIALEELAREMVRTETDHIDEVHKMLRKG